MCEDDISCTFIDESSAAADGSNREAPAYRFWLVRGALSSKRDDRMLSLQPLLLLGDIHFPASAQMTLSDFNQSHSSQYKSHVSVQV